MAEDYLTDDEQVEAVKAAFKEYAPWIVGGLVIGLGILFGYRWYGSHVTEQALKAGAQFGAMATALQGNDKSKARQIADGLIKEYPTSPYADQAQLTLARIAVDEGQDANAVAPLTAVMNGSKDAELKQIARLRLARVLIDQNKPDDAIKLLADGTPGSFAGRYHEVHGDALLAKHDAPGAIGEYKAAMAGGAGPESGVDSAMLQLKLADLGATDQPNHSVVKVNP
jgi:predicted negative regulator of RcsB-dependent stress response